MTEAPRPRVLFSRCLGFASCRYNGLSVQEPAVERIKPFVDVVTVCPEVEIGLGVPRSPIRLVGPLGAARLVQPETGKDVTEAMARFADTFLAEIGACDGAILKAASPSCGPRDVRAYAAPVRGSGFTKTRGAFAAAVLETRSLWTVEDEGRLRNFDLRGHFLTRIFASARLRSALARGRMSDLVAFHADHKLLLMAYNQTQMGQLGRIVANAERRPFSETASDYAQHFAAALERLPRRTSAINVLQHAFGYVSAQLEAKEKRFFLDGLEQFREGRVPLAVPVHLMQSLILRFDVPYLAGQAFFEPFPREMSDVLDSGKGRSVR
ncbi:MAG: DUF523 and DUF1722 domain-containing protein [Candidatus Bipolaricaulota bacterium]